MGGSRSRIASPQGKAPKGLRRLTYLEDCFHFPSVSLCFSSLPTHRGASRRLSSSAVVCCALEPLLMCAVIRVICECPHLCPQPTYHTMIRSGTTNILQWNTHTFTCAPSTTPFTISP